MEYKEKHEHFEAMEPDYLYKIGMFAAMNRVTVKTLRFYEEQGLLFPAHINEENGYRYYTMGQMATVHQISALKQAGFTLEDIARINAGSDEEAVILKKKSDLLQKIAELTKQIGILDGYLARKSGKLTTPVLVKTLPSVKVACIRDRLSSYDDLWNLMPDLGALMEEAELQCAIPEYCFTNYLEPEYKEEGILVEVCQAIVKPGKEVPGMTYQTMPETKAACAFHKGSYANFAETYSIVLQYIEDNDLKIAGPIRENYIDGVWNKEDESEWLSEIQIPVE